jgi:virulence factor Mce-like protein
MIDVREHISERINRARIELELRRSVRPLLVVVIGALVGLGITAFIASRVAKTLFTGSYTAQFTVEDATAVNPGTQELRFKGIPAGTVKAIDRKGLHPVVTVQWDKKYGPIYRDARAELRPNTALMDMYVNIVDRGTPSAGRIPEDEPIPLGQTSVSVNITDVLNVFGSDVRTRMAQLLDGLGNGLEDRGAKLNAAIVELAPLLRSAKQATEQIATRQKLTRRLVHNSVILTEALADRDAELRDMVVQSSSVLSTMQQHAPQLDATLRELPPTLDALNGSFTAVRGVLGDVNTAVRDLGPVADRVPAALDALRDLNAVAAPAVSRLQQPLDELVPVATRLRPLSGDLERAARALGPEIPVLDRTTVDLENCEDGIQGFFHWTASLGKFGDIRGPIPRGNLVVGPQAASIPSPIEYAPQACTPGKPISGRVPGPKDFH